jgi:hypothetical protein
MTLECKISKELTMDPSTIEYKATTVANLLNNSTITAKQIKINVKNNSIASPCIIDLFKLKYVSFS